MAGLEDEISWLGDANLVPDLYADLALEHVGVLVLVLVRVHRRGEDAWFDRVLDEREGLPVSAPPIMHRTPSPPSHTISPSSGDSTMRAWVSRSDHGQPPLVTPRTPVLIEW